MESSWISTASSSPPSPRHFLVAFSFVFVFVVARFFLDKFIFRELSIWLVYQKSRPSRINDATRATTAKCSESLWKLIYYATFETFVLRIIYSEPWLTDTYQYFSGWPYQELKLSLKLFYMCQCGFYLYSIVALITWETRRKDFSVIMSHHVITVLLIGYSYITSFFRIEAIILACMMQVIYSWRAKIFKYSGKELGASIFFGLFAISWLTLRLIFFPFWVIRASSHDVVNHLDLTKAYPTFLYYSFNTMLLMLLVFHIYWWVLICSMIMRQLRNRGRVGADIRSDSEDDE